MLLFIGMGPLKSLRGVMSRFNALISNRRSSTAQ